MGLSSVATFRKDVPAQPVDATLYNQLLWQYFPSRIDLYGSPPSEPKQGFALFELTPANEISPADTYRRTLSKCCIDPLRPPDISGLGDSLTFPIWQMPRFMAIHSSHPRANSLCTLREKRTIRELEDCFLSEDK
jgi:hypothetical protein